MVNTAVLTGPSAARPHVASTRLTVSSGSMSSSSTIGMRNVLVVSPGRRSRCRTRCRNRAAGRSNRGAPRAVERRGATGGYVSRREIHDDAPGCAAGAHDRDAAGSPLAFGESRTRRSENCRVSGERRHDVAGIADAIAVGILLAGIWNRGTVVSRIRHAVIVEVGIGIRIGRPSSAWKSARISSGVSARRWCCDLVDEAMPGEARYDDIAADDKGLVHLVDRVDGSGNCAAGVGGAIVVGTATPST